MNQEVQNSYQDDEVSVKELVLKIRQFYWEIIRNIKWVILAVALLVSFFVYRAMTTPVTYLANLTFMLNEEGGGGPNVGSLLGQFGLGGGGGGEYNLDKVVELSKSMRIIKDALFEKGKVAGVSDYYANHIIRTEGLHEKWREDTTGLKNFIFAGSETEKFSYAEKKALKTLYLMIKGDVENKVEGLLSIAYKQETGILKMGMNTQSSPLSIQFLREVYEKVSAFYIKESTEKPKVTHEKLLAKKDSLQQVLASKEYQLARVIDSNKGLVSRTAKLKIDRLQREVQLTTIAYGETLKNAELAGFTLKNAMPFFQIVDDPIEPLRPKRESLLKAIILGGVLGAFLAIVIIICRKIYRDAMEE